MERRPIPKIQTELEYAPTDREELQRAIGGFACSRDLQCRYQNCFTDRHHLIFSGYQGEELTELEQLARSHPDFIEPGVCRERHDRLHKTWDRSEPLGDDFLLGFLLASPEGLGANQQRRLREIYGKRT